MERQLASISATCRPTSPARWEKNLSLSHLVQLADVVMCSTPYACAWSAMSARKSTVRGAATGSPRRREATSALTS